MVANRLSRRRFLQVTAAAGGGFIVGLGMLPAAAQQPPAPPAGPGFAPWVRFAADGTVTALTNVSDMGQGTAGIVAQIVAEELDLPLASVRVEMAPVEPGFKNPFIDNYAIFGSLGFRTAYRTLGPVCAAARDILVQAAAAQWAVPKAECATADGQVRHAASNRALPYRDLLAAAASLTPAADVKQKPRKDWTILGKAAPRVDIPAKVDGSAVYGIDVKRPGMLVAAVLHAPTFGGTLQSVDEAPALAVRGVRQVVRLPGAVAVVADGYWQASKGAASLSPRWAPGPHAAMGSEAFSKQLHTTVATGRGKPFPAQMEPRLKPADAAKALAEAASVVDATFEVPFLAHATMEPMNATAHVTAEGAELWLPTQIQRDTQNAVSKALGLPAEKVTINTTLLGGGFGRRLEHDFAVEAALIAKAVGKPVKMVWSREVDMRAGRYRPATVARVRLALGKDGMPTAVKVDMASPSLLEYSGLVNGPPAPDPDWSTGMGWVRQSYAIPAMDLTWTRVDMGVPCGYWRSVGASQNSFFFEASLDQAARAAGIDPVEYRRRLLAQSPRALAFLEALADRAGWATPPAPGRFRGIAMGEANNAISGHVVEISLPRPGTFKLERVTAAIDAGVVGNPNSVEAQMMGGTLFGLSAALSGEITLKDGQVEQGNFDSYPLVTLAQVPPLDLLVLGTGDRVGGVGEEGVPTIGPAIANALLAATGKPVTRLPLSRAGWALAA